ncbi:hypothetical protein P7K49_017217 [Saguinus oedipus]|uniref:Uncharacterized protein n=1 Tax=Saguinus oedipus TaxID=9490 RepID=A0ABQ9V1W7_SAGOE|nr:hypothetical protein P7K49_017217 [Saguinus oedipus]
MLAVSGPGPLFCLLLLLLTSHSPEAGRTPLRRFEYKLSFKGPRLALPGAGIPFWSHHGETQKATKEWAVSHSTKLGPASGPGWQSLYNTHCSGPSQVWVSQLV